MSEERTCETCLYETRAIHLEPCSKCKHTVYCDYDDPRHDFWEPKLNPNPYWERICKLSDRQRVKGMETYGQGLESNPAALVERINHLEEELIDGLMYCEWIKDKLMELEGENNGSLPEQN